VLALVMLALLPISWNDSLKRDGMVESATGYETELPGSEEPREQEGPVERRAGAPPRAAAAALAVRLGTQAALARRDAAPYRRESPYIPHPSRFSERRLI
jgi:hypothetical protein